MSVSAGRVDDPPLRRTFRHAALTYGALAAALAGIACTAGCASPSAAREDGHSVTRTLRTLLPQGEAGAFRDTGVRENEPLAPVILTYEDAKGVGPVERPQLPVQRLDLVDSHLELMIRRARLVVHAGSRGHT